MQLKLCGVDVTSWSSKYFAGAWGARVDAVNKCIMCCHFVADGAKVSFKLDGLGADKYVLVSWENMPCHWWELDRRQTWKMYAERIRTKLGQTADTASA